jgi:Cu(I)/Ag(I) efflux system membrane fusion protein
MSPIRYVVLALPLAALAAAGGYWYAMSRLHAVPADAATAPPSPPPSAPQGDRKVLYWYDPMYPQSRFDKPGKSPFMDMMLVPKYADAGGDESGVSISPRVVQNLGVRTAEARPGSLAQKLDAVGNVEYNERAVVLMQARTAGFVEKLHVRAPLDPVREGEPLVEILFPEWAAAQAEYLALKRLAGADVEPLQRAARERLLLAGMSEAQIAAVEREGTVQARTTLRAPVSGVVAELGAREGMTVAAGTMLFRIAGLGTVWIVAEVPEAQAGALVPGAVVDARVPTYPEEVFKGRVSAILPEVNAATRTLRARVEVANPAGKLKPGMYATLALGGRGRAALLVPSEAVIRTGERSVVILAAGEGNFRAVDVEVGAESGGDAEIRKGLKAGDRVVVSGQFLIDSEASLRTTLARLEGAGAAAPPAGGAGAARPSGAGADAGKPRAAGADAPAAGIHRGTATVTGVDLAQRRIELDHGPIPSMKWPSMTMAFGVDAAGELAHVRKGDRVEFEFRGKPTADGDYIVTRITPVKRPPR